MTANKNITTAEPLRAMHTEDMVEIGKWYLLETDKENLYLTHNGFGSSDESNEVYKGEGQVLVCVHSFQSNLVIVKSNQRTFRILNKDLGQALSDIDQNLVLSMIQEKGQTKQLLISEAQKEINAIVGRIHNSGNAKSDSTELMVSSSNALIEQKRMLKEVHGTAINLLNEQIRTHVSAISEIVKYYSLPAVSGITDHTKITNVINDKLYELDLYGGMSEEEEIISTGAVASEKDPIYIFQDLKYMDVECLLGYETGGINVNSIAVFNGWLAKPENRDRILPKERSIVAIKIRKYREQRIFGFQSDSNDTFLYLRNGENIKSIKTNLKVGDKLLATENDISSRQYVKKVGSYGQIDKNFVFLSANEFEHLSDQSEKLKALFLDNLLDAHRAKHQFLIGLRDYSKIRHEKLNDSQIKESYPKVLLLDDGSTIRHSKLSQKEFDSWLELNQKTIDETLENIEVIKSSIRNNLSSINIGYYNFSSTSFSKINSREVGFIDNDGVEHKLKQNSSQLMKSIEDITRKYREMNLYFPNSDRSHFRSDEGVVNPYRLQKDLSGYSLMNEDHYYFDDLKDISWRQYMRQNDLAILIQGLIDRTEFFGYTEASLFKDNYSEHIKLIYDKDKGLYNGDMPDFNEFISKCNEGSMAGDVFYGHHPLWDDLEEMKAERRQMHDPVSIEKYLKAEKVTKKRDGRVMVKFRWETELDYWSKSKADKKVHTFECDIKDLINVSNYKLGDCKPFVEDPRCRDAYRVWGDRIISAEKYHYRNKRTL